MRAAERARQRRPAGAGGLGGPASGSAPAPARGDGPTRPPHQLREPHGAGTRPDPTGAGPVLSRIRQPPSPGAVPPGGCCVPVSDRRPRGQARSPVGTRAGGVCLPGPSPQVLPPVEAHRHAVLSQLSGDTGAGSRPVVHQSCHQLIPRATSTALPQSPWFPQSTAPVPTGTWGHCHCPANARHQPGGTSGSWGQPEVAVGQRAPLQSSLPRAQVLPRGSVPNWEQRCPARAWHRLLPTAVGLGKVSSPAWWRGTGAGAP